MGKTTIYLIRHGEVDNPKNIIYGRRPLSLTVRGFEQIKRLADSFKKKDIIPAAIYTSPVKRARQTADMIGNEFPKAQITEDRDLQEVDCARLEGKSLSWLHSIGDDSYYHKDTKDLGVERPEAIIKRIVQAIEKIRHTYAGQTVFVVGHGDPLAFGLWKFLNPSKTPVSHKELIDGTYLDKSAAVKLVFKDNQLMEHEFFVPKNTL